MYSFLCDFFFVLFVSLFKLKLFCVIVCKARSVWFNLGGRRVELCWTISVMLFYYAANIPGNPPFCLSLGHWFI